MMDVTRPAAPVLPSVEESLPWPIRRSTRKHANDDCEPNPTKLWHINANVITAKPSQTNREYDFRKTWGKRQDES
jgi:hypothetical protein